MEVFSNSVVNYVGYEDLKSFSKVCTSFNLQKNRAATTIQRFWRSQKQINTSLREFFSSDEGRHFDIKRIVHKITSEHQGFTFRFLPHVRVFFCMFDPLRHSLHENTMFDLLSELPLYSKALVKKGVLERSYKNAYKIAVGCRPMSNLYNPTKAHLKMFKALLPENPDPEIFHSLCPYVSTSSVFQDWLEMIN
uniref:Uncharacterized protein n=1 Tax=Tetraselmis sp. GSL018 TaxID=582737 RepID=A0A061QW34_9CHLO|eukprot:CAMPEP_0177615000 /NCGR_PEP_ID=MMETSP0419_2-20121207/23117_1 /TAXON_ID=582737 /ORGANISM="Tetraselmis sp., Strain GSL018" /LENGTH=192 /DNA_ID=CAMNT_0019112419 /DNA_START=114 /DNA_END=692 /DNA_ORIENTATION=+